MTIDNLIAALKKAAQNIEHEIYINSKNKLCNTQISSPAVWVETPTVKKIDGVEHKKSLYDLTFHIIHFCQNQNVGYCDEISYNLMSLAEKFTNSLSQQQEIERIENVAIHSNQRSLTAYGDNSVTASFVITVLDCKQL